MKPKPVVHARIVLIVAALLCLAGAAMAVTPAHAQDGEPQPVAPAQAESSDIIGGREAEPGAWPWQVALVNSLSTNAFTGQFCGGTLIDDEWVLTAAHCLEGAEPTLVDVLVGAHELSKSGTRVSSAQLIPHPGYDPYNAENDLALIRLSSPVTYTPISLYAPISGTTELDFVRATVIGWGAKSSDGWNYSYPDALREVALPLVSGQQCGQYNPYLVPDKMLCAGYETLTKGACYGDSGGPLMVQRSDSSWAQIGIVSYGPYGCVAYYPGGGYDVFTRVSTFTDWIAACMSTPDALSCRGGDSFEPDNGAASAQHLTLPTSNQMHTLHEEGDLDWMRIDVEEGHTYLFVTARITETARMIDTALWLFAADGHTPITYTESVDTLRWSWVDPFYMPSAAMSWTADRTGPVFLSVEMLPDPYGTAYGATSRYWLTIAEVAPTYLPDVLWVIGPGDPGTGDLANDDFDHPVEVALLPFTHSMDTTGATSAADDPVLCAGYGGSTVWYRLVAPATGPLSVDTLGSSYDTVLAVFSGTRGALTRLVCSDDYYGLQSQVWLDVVAGETYYIEVASFSPSSAVTAKGATGPDSDDPIRPSGELVGGALTLNVLFGEPAAAEPIPVVPASIP